MLEQISDEKKPELARKRQDLSVVLGTETSGSIALQLPEADELTSIRDLYFQKVMATEVSDEFCHSWNESIQDELHRLLRKKENYKKSPTFLSHLATLSEFSGDMEGCVEHLRIGLTVDDTSYCRERLGQTLIGLNNYSDAESVFRDGDLRADASANLGLAFIEALRGEYPKASEFVKLALEIDATNWRALLLAGALELRGENADQAIRFFRSASEDRESSSAPYLLLAAAYCRSARMDKAIEVLKRAVAMNPADENAVIFFADALMSEKRYDHASQAVAEFIHYEQKSTAGWDRLARSFFAMGLNLKALESLRHQASISEGPGVWNNMGLVFWRMGDNTRAVQYLTMAMESTMKAGFPSFLPFYNAFVHLRNVGKLDEALKISELIPANKLSDLAKERISSTMLALRCEALVDTGRIDQAEAELEYLFTLPDKNKNLYHGLLVAATYFYSLVRPNAEKAIKFSKLALKEAQKKNMGRELLGTLLNNVVFALLEFGRIKEAEEMLPQISPWIHKSPTATATLGLLHLKKGHFESGKALYEEALALTGSGTSRRRLKQKMELEIGKFLLMQGNSHGAARHLQEAASASTGLRAIELEAAELLRTLHE